MKRPAVLIAVAAVIAARMIAAAGASAHPVISGHQVPHVFVKRPGAAPTTQLANRARL